MSLILFTTFFNMFKMDFSIDSTTLVNDIRKQIV